MIEWFSNLKYNDFEKMVITLNDDIWVSSLFSAIAMCFYTLQQMYWKYCDPCQNQEKQKSSILTNQNVTKFRASTGNKFWELSSIV